VIDSLAYPGGQCVELYPDKPIYDIPAMPVCTGQELTDAAQADRAVRRDLPLGQEVTVVKKQADGRFFVQTSKGTQFLTKTIFIAAGVGAFQPRTLKVDGLDKFDGSQLFYRVKNPADFAGKNLVIVGGGDSALDWALDFVKEPAQGRERHPDPPPRRLQGRAGERGEDEGTVRRLRDAVHHRPGHRLRGKDGNSPASRSPAPTRSPASCRWTCCWCSSA
jgi:cation diffusion facilitator CzcD-associated flavoprotein CzcO